MVVVSVILGVLGLIGIFVFASESLSRSRVRKYRKMGEDEQSLYIERLGEYADRFIHREKGVRKIDWAWAGENLFLAFAVPLGIIAGYPTLQGYGVDDPISGPDKVTLMILLVGWLVIYVFIRRYRINNYRCKQCKLLLHPRPKPSSNLAFICNDCDLYWDTLDANNFY